MGASVGSLAGTAHPSTRLGGTSVGEGVDSYVGSVMGSSVGEGVGAFVGLLVSLFTGEGVGLSIGSPVG